MLFSSRTLDLGALSRPTRIFNSFSMEADMWIIVLALLLAGAQCSLTAFAPAAPGKAWALWPFEADARPVVEGIGGLPKESGSVVTPILAGVAGAAFLLAAVGLFGKLLPVAWWQPVVLAGAIAAILLTLAYARALGLRAILPLAVSILLILGVLVQGWTPAVLRGS
jgi:hypothetical protein